MQGAVRQTDRPQGQVRQTDRQTDRTQGQGQRQACLGEDWIVGLQCISRKGLIFTSKVLYDITLNYARTYEKYHLNRTFKLAHQPAMKCQILTAKYDTGRALYTANLHSLSVTVFPNITLPFNACAPCVFFFYKCQILNGRIHIQRADKIRNVFIF